MEENSLNEETFKKFIKNPFQEKAVKYTILIGWNRSFENLSINENILLKSDEEYSFNLIFNKCNFKKITIDSAVFNEFIIFKNCVFDDDFVIYNGSLSTLIFQNCSFRGQLIIYNITIKTFSLENCISENPIQLRGGQIQKMIYDSHDEKTHLKISGYFTFIGQLNIITIIGATVTISESIVRLLKFEGDYNSSSRINVKEIKNVDVSLDNINNDGKFYFTNFQVTNVISLNFPSLENIISNLENVELKLEANNLIKYSKKIQSFPDLYHYISTSQDLKTYLYGFYYREITVIENLEAKPNLVIQYSSMGNFELKNMPLEKYEIIVMSTDLSSIKLINTFSQFLKNRGLIMTDLVFLMIYILPLTSKTIHTIKLNTIKRRKNIYLRKFNPQRFQLS